MFVGIICACMPSAAYAARQQNSAYNHIIGTASSLKTRLFVSKNSFASRPPTNHTQLSEEPANVLQSTDQKYAQYFNLDTLTSAGSLSNMNGVSTTVHSPKERGSAKLSGSGIQRQFDVDIERR